ncbi:Sec-independent protein translocase protein TatB [Aurantimonas sp. Leaf443]|uniref:Sec-independent protein translocase protein TatB n=1 Tax=Aurantimonas sp. Leaf443 TaxID=1736378 RepID=UPI0006FA3285|nr:preprotein translocase [Aurantimonas sp. Leaf443]
MFDIGWSELLVIAVVLIVVVGPKDLPRMLRTFGRTTTQLRSMASDFRRQFDDALREAELDEVRDTVRDVRNLDPTKDIRAAMNPMRAIGDEIRSSLTTATRAPEPRVPSAGEPAKPADAVPSVAATGAPVASSDPGIMPAGTASAETATPASPTRKTEDAA